MQLQRERLLLLSRQPLLYVGDDLVYVAGLGIDARFQAAAGAFLKAILLKCSIHWQS